MEHAALAMVCDHAMPGFGVPLPGLETQFQKKNQSLCEDLIMSYVNIYISYIYTYIIYYHIYIFIYIPYTYIYMPCFKDCYISRSCFSPRFMAVSNEKRSIVMAPRYGLKHLGGSEAQKWTTGGMICCNKQGK